MRDAGKTVMASFLPARMRRRTIERLGFEGRHGLFRRGAFRAARSPQPFDRRRDNEIEPIWFPQRHVSIAYALALNAEITRPGRAKKGKAPPGGQRGSGALAASTGRGIVVCQVKTTMEQRINLYPIFAPTWLSPVGLDRGVGREECRIGRADHFQGALTSRGNYTRAYR